MIDSKANVAVSLTTEQTQKEEIQLKGVLRRNIKKKGVNKEKQQERTSKKKKYHVEVYEESKIKQHN